VKANRNNYEVIVTQTKTPHWKKVAFDSTVRFDTKVSDLNSYIMCHSPIRQEEYCVELKNIPSFVSVHLVRHKIGVEHYVLSNRDDRHGDPDADRFSPINHTMFINAEALITLANKRLCNKAHKETKYIVGMIKNEINKKNHDLALCMVPNCVYRNGLCPELKGGCKQLDNIMEEYSYYKELFNV